MTIHKHILFMSIALLFTACGNDGGDHGHPHDRKSDHAHETKANAIAAEHGHAHGDGTHVHDSQETEAFYGDEASGETDEVKAHAAEKHPHSDEGEHADDGKPTEENHTHQGDAAHGHEH